MLNKQNTGLIVTDVQGELARLVDDSDALIRNCEKLIKGVQALGLPIILLEQNPDKLGATVSKISTLLVDQSPISKFTFDACEAPEFMSAINNANVDNWLICGIETHICVYQTALHLRQSGYKVQLVCDCVSSRTLANKHLAINKLIDRGVDMTGLEMCLYELVKDCRATEFKEILGLIR
jgi:nicotinamidase-related amidase